MTPRGRLIGIALAATIPWIGAALYPSLWPLAAMLIAGLVVVAAIDGCLAPRLSRLVVDREETQVLSVGAKNPQQIRIRNTTKRTLQLRVHDEQPANCTCQGLPLRVVVPAGRQATIRYHVVPQRRGNGTFGAVHVRASTPLRLWECFAEFPRPQAVRIFPDVQAVRLTDLLTRQNRLAEAGVRLSRLRGRGSEFERLREYRIEDEYRSIDWKATARTERLVSREYVVERNQNVILILDSGRAMCHESNGVTHFDRALNASLLLAHRALKQGDTVGMLIGADEVRRWVKPQRGPRALTQIVRQVYDVHPEYAPTSYSALVEAIRQRNRKRSLIIVVTHAIDEVHFESMGRHLAQLRTPHLVLVALLRNVELEDRLALVPDTDIEAFQVAAAAELTLAHQAQRARLERQGVLVVESRPDELSGQLISQYLDIKARHRL